MIATAAISALIAYLGVRWQFSRDLEKMKMEMAYQGKLEALKIGRERAFRQNKIQELTEKAKVLSQQLAEDSSSVSDSIDGICGKRLDSLKQSWASRGGWEGVSGGKTFFEMDVNRIKSKCNQDIKRWATMKRREIDDILLEVKWLKNLKVVDTLPVPSS